jgi:hypothetical protein
MLVVPWCDNEQGPANNSYFDFYFAAVAASALLLFQYDCTKDGELSPLLKSQNRGEYRQNGVLYKL